MRAINLDNFPDRKPHRLGRMPQGHFPGRYFFLDLIKFLLNSFPMQALAALADPTRRRIVELLAQRERTTGEIVEEFDLSAPAISQHLNVLREAGLVATRAEGQLRIQSLNPAGLDELGHWLERTRRTWSRRLDALERELRADDEAKKKSSKS
jgi:DNA-binding transcriptional ArsR family regulator